MAVPEQFSLRWNDFHSNLSQSFHALLEGEDLVDVTLAAGGQYVHAHKLILSVCSPYFKELFKMNPCEHPIVILKDVAHQELRQLLQFMYRGEVHVRQQELFGFLHTAEMLQVKGLTVGRETSESPPMEVSDDAKPKQEPKVEACEPQAEWVPGGEETIATETPPSVVPADVLPKDETTRSPLKRLLKNTGHKNSYNVKKERRSVNDAQTMPENTEYTSDNEPLIDFDNDLFHSVLVLPESAKAGWNCKPGGVKCPNCHRLFANRYNLKVHIRDKHDTREGTLQCDICHKRMRNPSCLRVHMYHHRKQAAYLAQLSSQPDHMTQVIQNMSGKSWRKDASPGNVVDYRDFDTSPNPSPGKWKKEASPSSGAGAGSDFRDTENIQNASGKAWRKDASPGNIVDYRDLDISPNPSPRKWKKETSPSSGAGQGQEYKDSENRVAASAEGEQPSAPQPQADVTADVTDDVTADVTAHADATAYAVKTEADSVYI